MPTDQADLDSSSITVSVPEKLARARAHQDRVVSKRRNGSWGQQWRGPEAQSSLGYLFGGGEAPKPAVEKAPPVQKASPPPVDVSKQIPAGIQVRNTNDYYRADGPNSGNFITDRPSTKVHYAPGGGSSLDYLFGGEK